MIITLIKYIKSFVSITPRGMASKCSPMERYVNDACCYEPGPPEFRNEFKQKHESDLNSKRDEEGHDGVRGEGRGEHPDTDVTSADQNKSLGNRKSQRHGQRYPARQS